MAHGRPVINTNLSSGVPWVARDGREAITVTADDVEELSAAIQRFAYDCELVDQRGEAAERRVKSEFNYTLFCDRTEALYSALCVKGSDHG
ncbi:hypothetical protein GCM10008090_04850 [Arenicella chitinivorans]|uniref:Uncharacterized protein n=2 Tax=Arenicella chitinivorans TaxID=1329800 RepID=A0A918RGQ6_9GAMM|nr:hypothetical protein GCM10008090_04850 [Arenicella chitinivorans]